MHNHEIKRGGAQRLRAIIHNYSCIIRRWPPIAVGNGKSPPIPACVPSPRRRVAAGKGRSWRISSVHRTNLEGQERGESRGSWVVFILVQRGRAASAGRTLKTVPLCASYTCGGILFLKIENRARVSVTVKLKYNPGRMIGSFSRFGADSDRDMEFRPEEPRKIFSAQGSR